MIRYLNQEEILNVYPKIFLECFGYEDKKFFPSIVMVEEIDGKIIAFLSGVFENIELFHLQYCGVTPEKRDKKLVIDLLERGLLKLKEDYKYRFVVFEIENTNIPAQIVVLKSGFYFNGMKTSFPSLRYRPLFLPAIATPRGFHENLYP